jgi:hypothetical protein
LDYESGASTSRSRLIAVQEYGSDGVSILPEQTFVWQEGTTGHFGTYNSTLDAGAGEEYDHRFVDINGDGMVDLVGIRKTGSNIFVRFSNGNGYFGNFNSTLDAGAGDEYDHRFEDINGDGMADLIGIRKTGQNIYARFSNGDGHFGNPNNTLDAGAGQEYDHTFADINGDGKLDLIGMRITGQNIYVRFQDGEFPDILTIVNNGTGGVITVDYTSAPQSSLDSHVSFSS